MAKHLYNNKHQIKDIPISGDAKSNRRLAWSVTKEWICKISCHCFHFEWMNSRIKQFVLYVKLRKRELQRRGGLSFGKYFQYYEYTVEPPITDTLINEHLQ
jgi:hypothetical protein